MNEPSTVQSSSQSAQAAMVLQDWLPADYLVVQEPIVAGRPLDVVIVGPQGLFALQTAAWEGEVLPARRGPWSARSASGDLLHHPSPYDRARRETQAIESFLKDEFPTLNVPIHHILLLTNAETKLTAPAEPELKVASLASLAEAVTSFPVPEAGPALDEVSRQSLSTALAECELTTSQKASAPFVFRSGGFLGTARRAWTLHTLVRHLDRYPEDASFHLLNGTLTRWLEQQGARRLAELAHEVVHFRNTDPQTAVERFLLGTGLVRRPRLALGPRRLNMGPVMSGGIAERRLRVRQGRGRGYLFGTLRATEPWLHVEPRDFAGRASELLVTADTESLSISSTPWQAEIVVESSASEEPVSVPVRVHVVGMPSWTVRFLLRPAAAALSAALLGSVLGWGLGWSVAKVPAWFSHVAPALAVSPQLAWAILVGAAWALLGAVRGFCQPLAWPVSHATANWLLHTAKWSAALILLAAAGYASWLRFGPGVADGSAVRQALTILLSAVAAAMLPVTISQMRRSRREEPQLVRGSVARRPRKGRRLAALAVAGLVLALVLVLGVPLVGRTWQHVDAQNAVSSASTWATDQWGRLENTVNAWLDKVIPKPVDHRVPFEPAPSEAPGGGKLP